MDLDYNSVTLLLLGNGINGSTTITNNAPSPVAVTATGSAAISTAQSVYGGASILLTGGSLTAAAFAGFGFGAGDFTIEGWLKHSNNSTSVPLLGITHGGVSAFVTMDCPGGGAPSLIKFTDAGAFVASSPSASVVTSVWTHFAVVRSSGVVTVYTNGVGGTGVAYSTDLHATGSIIVGGGGLAGHLDDFRVTKGVARYTANFTPPAAQFDTAMPSYAILACPALTLAATGSYDAIHMAAGITLPGFAFSATTGANAALTTAAWTLAALGGANAPMMLPALAVSAAAHDSKGENLLDVTLGAITFGGYGGASVAVRLPPVSVDAAGVVTGWASATLTLPAWLAEANGLTGGVGAANMTMGLALAVRGYGGAVLAVTLQDGFTVAGSALGGALGRAGITLPLFELSASATVNGVSRAALTLPELRLGSSARATLALPRFELTAIGHAVVALTYEAYAVNLLSSVDRNPQNQFDPNVSEVTHYINYPFTQIVRHNNAYYGVAADGLYLLEGDTDAGAPIAWAFRTALSDGGSKQLKRVRSVYIGARLISQVETTLVVGEEQDLAYRYTTPRSGNAQNHRQLFGKGVRARYFALEVGDPAGNFIEIDSLDLENEILERAI